MSEAGPGDAVSSTDATSERRIVLEADDGPALLRLWLQELLFLHETEAFAFHDGRFAALESDHLDANVLGVTAASRPAREIKGVTHHGLVMREDGNTWRARVIFDL